MKHPIQDLHEGFIATFAKIATDTGDPGYLQLAQLLDAAALERLTKQAGLWDRLVYAFGGEKPARAEQMIPKNDAVAQALGPEWWRGQQHQTFQPMPRGPQEAAAAAAASAPAAPAAPPRSRVAPTISMQAGLQDRVQQLKQQSLAAGHSLEELAPLMRAPTVAPTAPGGGSGTHAGPPTAISARTVIPHATAPGTTPPSWRGGTQVLPSFRPPSGPRGTMIMGH
jgi:hypothetical protein